MEIIRAQKKNSGEILAKIEALLCELDGKPFDFDKAEIRRFTEESIESGDFIVLLAKDQSGKVIGLITLSESRAIYAQGRYGIIHEFFVDPAYRSKRVGEKLMHEAKKLCKEFKWKRLEVGAPAYPQWRRTKEFYIREGFIEVGPRLKWIAE